MDLLLGTPTPDFKNRKTQNEFSVDFSSDLQFNELGLLRTVEDKNKLTQQIAKILLTEQGKNLFIDTYGTILNSFIGIPVSEDTTFALMKQTILDALGILVAIQQDIDNEPEKLATIETISATFNENKKNEVRIDLVITTEADQTILTSFIFPTLG